MVSTRASGAPAEAEGTTRAEDEEDGLSDADRSTLCKLHPLQGEAASNNPNPQPYIITLPNKGSEVWDIVAETMFKNTAGTLIGQTKTHG